MMAPECRLHGRRVAPFHIQIEILKGSTQPRVASEVEIHGRIVRTFRTDGRLKSGDNISFDNLWVCRPGDEPTGPAYVYYDDFIQATHMEVYLDGNPPKCKLAAYEFTLLHGASDEPVMSVAQLENELRCFGEILDIEPSTPVHPIKTTMVAVLVKVNRLSGCSVPNGLFIGRAARTG